MAPFLGHTEGHGIQLEIDKLNLTERLEETIYRNGHYFDYCIKPFEHTKFMFTTAFSYILTPQMKPGEQYKSKSATIKIFCCIFRILN